MTLKEFFFGKKPEPLLFEGKNPLAKVVTSNYTRSETPVDVQFSKLIHYHDRTPQIQVAVSSYSELITGTEMTIKTKSEEAQFYLEDWIRRVDFYNKFESVVTTLLICGNALLEKIDENNIEDVVEVDMSTIIGKKRDDFGVTQWYEHRTNQGQTEKLGEGKLGKFIEFNLTHFGRKVWANSLFYSLAVPRVVGNRTTAPMVENMWGLEDAMVSIILNNAWPITTITYPGASDDFLRKETIRWGIYKPGDKRVQKIKPEIEFFEADSKGGKYEFLVSHIEKVFELGTQFPHDILTGDFTSRASSETTESIVMKKVRGYQKYLSNKLKTDLFDPILIQGGFDPEKEELLISFQSQNIIELTPDQVQGRGATKMWTTNEVREWDRTNLGVELPDDKEIEAEKEMQQTIASNAQDIKKSIKKEAMNKVIRCKMCKENQHAFCSKRRCKCNHE